MSEKFLVARNISWYTAAVANVRGSAMGKYTSVVIGAAVVAIGVIGLIRWIGPFVIILKGCVPALLIFGGAIAVIAGLSEMKDETAAKKEETK